MFDKELVENVGKRPVLKYQVMIRMMSWRCVKRLAGEDQVIALARTGS